MSENELYDYAITLLAKKDYSSGGMNRLLSKLTEKEEYVDLVIHRLNDNRYLNNENLINTLINKHVKKLHGPTRIKQEIR